MTLLVWGSAIALLWAPGFLLATALRLTHRDDRAVAVAIQLALGLSIWPLAFLWTSAAQLRWSVPEMRWVTWLTVAIAVAVWGRRNVLSPGREGRPRRLFAVVLAVLFALTVGLRISQVRDLAFPPWVDGVHHVMLTRLLLDRGAVPRTADPYIPGGELYYHWGFHAGFALVAAATARSSPPSLPPLLLQYGQLLSALSFLAVYAAGRILLGSREGGILAAVLAMFVSYYPAFYVSWGRYPHLAGTLVLPPLVIVLWRLGRSRSRFPWRPGAAAAILAAGLGLIHVRVAFFGLAFAIILAFAVALRFVSRPGGAAGRRRHFVRLLARWGIVAGVSLLLLTPWLLQLRRGASARRVLQSSQEIGATSPSWLPLLRSPHNRELLSLATGGISGMAGWMEMPLSGRIASAVWFLLIVGAWRAGRRWGSARPFPSRPLALLAAWVAVLAVVLYWRPPGLDLTGLASLDSAVITLFLPLSLGGGALAAWVIARLCGKRGMAVSCVAALVVAAACGSALTDIVNPVTVFADARDLQALEWIERHVRPDALVAIDGRPWIAPAWVGVDGGYWIGAATTVRSILPPLLYAWALPPAEVMRINALEARWSNRARVSDRDAWAAIRGAGVTHIYCGSYGARWKRQELEASRECRAIYRDGGAAVFEVRRVKSEE